MKMKLKKLMMSVLAATAVAGFVSSCSDDDQEMTMPPYVSLTNDQGEDLQNLVFDAQNGPETVVVKSNAEWTFEVADDAAQWITIDPVSDKGNKTVSVTAADNKSLDMREADVTVKVKGQRQAGFKIIQAGLTPMLMVATETEEIPAEGGEVTFNVVSNVDWTYAVDPANTTETAKTDDKLTLTFPPSPTEEKVTYKVTFTYAGNTEEITIDQKGQPKPVPQADLLDIVFKADGTAEDVSPMHNAVITKEGSTLMTYYSETHKRVIANFRNTMGTNVTTGYYRVNYTKGGEFINRIADGCTMETIIRMNEADAPNAEVKWFSSMQAGGIGFILPIHTQNKSLTFLPNVSTTGSSNWRWTYSNVVPEVGRYYHVVGVWNKEEGKSYIYVNGELKGTASAPGNYVPVAAGAESFILGGDPGTNQIDCSASWNGEIVTARIYDDALTAEQIESLWEKDKFDVSAAPMTVSELQYMPSCEVAVGYKYSVYGKGFQSGDVIKLVSKDGSKQFDPATAIAADAATITIPAGFTTGDYKLMLVRGEATLPLCMVNFTVSDNPVKPKTPKVIAHRGAHTDGASENSLAALRKAMDANYYGIELDVWITTDGQLVVHHDGVASGLTFQNCTYSQIKNIKLSNGESLPTFDSFISTFKSKMDKSSSKLIIEFKTHSGAARNYAAIDKVMKMVADNNLKDRVEYIAFSYDNCKHIVANDQAAIVGYLNGDLTPAKVKADGIRSIDYSTTAFANHPEWIRQALDLGVIVNVWTVNSVSDMMRYIGMGADYITTDAPATLETLCERKFVSE